MSAAAAPASNEQPVEQAKSLEEGLAAAAEYKGDPLDCPCIAHMKEGPCGSQFVVAYKCFLDSKEEEKGSDCVESFRAMQRCFLDNPEYYDQFLKDHDDDEEEELKEKTQDEKDAEDAEWHAWNFRRPEDARK